MMNPNFERGCLHIISLEDKCQQDNYWGRNYQHNNLCGIGAVQRICSKQIHGVQRNPLGHLTEKSGYYYRLGKDCEKGGNRKSCCHLGGKSRHNVNILIGLYQNCILNQIILKRIYARRFKNYCFYFLNFSNTL